MPALWAWITSPRGRTILYWTAHVLFVVLGVALLAYLNHQAAFDRLVVSPIIGLNRWWLPLLFLALYALGWLGWWLLQVVGPDRAPTDFSDLSQSWATLRIDLNAAGLFLSELPVYLVLGKPKAGIEAFFQASRLPFVVRRVEGPLAVFANREGIFVCCPGASLLAELTERLHQQPSEPPPATQLAGMPTEPTASRDAQTDTATTALLIEPVAGVSLRRRAAQLSLLKTDQAPLLSQRVRQVCRMLAADRQPLCPVNGIIALVPFDATEGDAEAIETAAVLRHELALARAALQLDAPRYVVLADAHREEGFRYLTALYPEQSGPSRLFGQNFPLTPDLPATEVASMIQSGLGWVNQVMLPLALVPLMRREGEGDIVDRTQAIHQNIVLYQYLIGMRDRLHQLARVVSLGLPDYPPYLAGCYLVGTGSDSRDQGFVTGVLRRAIELQNAVRWTPEALAEDRALHRTAWMVYGVLAVFLFIVLLALWNA
ncbi:MAG: type VI secretion protein IcmF/TssM N-terminal domain-containing protein [Gemmataceae bacterium]